MAHYYVSPYGSDTQNNGLGPDPSDPTNKPFATLAKALASGAGTLPGDTVHIAPGVYRANTTVGVSGSSGSPVNVVGDPGNSCGFKDGSGNLLSAGEVRCTSYLANDVTAPTSGSVLLLSGASYISFSNIWFVGVQPTISGGGSVHIYNGAHDVSFTACAFSTGMVVSASYALVAASNTVAQLALNLLFDRCVFVGFGPDVIRLVLSKTSSGTGDYSANVTVQNSFVLGGSNQVVMTSQGAGTYLGGDVNVRNCTFIDGRVATVVVADAGISSTTYPVRVTNSIIVRTNSPSFSATTAGQIVEDYNHVIGGRTNVTAGANSSSDGSKCLMLDFGQWMLWGQCPRPFMTPTPGSPLLGFGNAAGAPAYDWLGRPRPEGGKSLANAVGYLERHDTAVQETTVVDAGSSIRIDGPGSHEFQIPVDATSTTISVKCRYDANHGTATPPQAVLVAAPEVGVSAQTITAPATTDSWSTLSFAAINPTARGVVCVRLVARPAAADGKAYFDTFAVS